MSDSMRLRFMRSPFRHAIARRCSEQSCRLLMSGMANFVVLKGERLSTTKICDCIIFYRQKSCGVALVELKSSYSHPSAVAEKFANALEIAAAIHGKVGLDIKEHHLILLSKSHRNPIAHDLLAQIKIKAGGSTRRILLKKCGCRLSSIIVP